MDFIDLLGIIQSNSTQRTILLLLNKYKALNQTEIARKIEKKQPTISYQIKKLEEVDLVNSVKIGKIKIYKLTEKGIQIVEEINQNVEK